MKEIPECPHCSTVPRRDNPEYLGKGRWLCQTCAKEFTVPKGLRSA